MKLTKRKNGIWQLTYSGNRISTGERDKAKAIRVAKVIIENDGQRPAKRASKQTLGDALEDTYERIWQYQKGERSARYRMNFLKREYGHVLLIDISYKWLTSFVEKLRKQGNSNATINRKLAALGKALRESHKMGYLDSVPPMPTQPEPLKKFRWLTRAEEDKLCSVVPELMVRSEAEFMTAFMRGLAYTGARVSEYLKACREIEYSPNRIIFEDRKNSTTGGIPVEPPVFAWLQTCTDFIESWEQERSNPRIDTDWVVHRFKRIRKAADLPDVSLHTFRHTCASRLVQGGTDLYKVRDWLGHTSIKTTERYAHLAPESLDDMTTILLGNEPNLRVIK